MEFNRIGQSRPTNASQASAPAAPAASKPASAAAASADNFKQGKLFRWSFIALLISATVLIVATIFFIAFGRSISTEAKYVAKDQYQAVFVNVSGTNGGQVYFGKVASLTPQYVRLTNVFYIQNQQTQQGQQAAYNLVKLGCELHGPTDEMIINRDQVFFWENLKADGQVAQKIAEYKKQNPNGQQCKENSGSTDQSSGSTQQSGNSQTSGNATSTTPQASPAPSASPATNGAAAKKQ